MIRPVAKLSQRAFTLVEVMVAVTILMICMTAILMLVNQNLELVKLMQERRPDLGALAGETLMDPVQPNEQAPSLNQLNIGVEQPFNINFEDNPGGDGESLYKKSLYERDITEIDATNGLYRVTVSVIKNNSRDSVGTRLSFLMFRPDLAKYLQGQQSGGE